MLEEIGHAVAICRTGVAHQVQIFGEHRVRRDPGGAQDGPKPGIGAVITGESELSAVEGQDVLAAAWFRGESLGLRMEDEKSHRGQSGEET